MQASRDPGFPDDVPPPYRRMEPAAAGESSVGIPSKVWASIILGFAWGFVAGILAGPLPLGARLIILPLGYVAGSSSGTWVVPRSLTWTGWGRSSRQSGSG